MDWFDSLRMSVRGLLERTPFSTVPESRVFVLFPYRKGDTFQATVITRELVTRDTVESAWAHAVRYTARGLDLPDYPAALRLLQERHPSWAILPYPAVPIAVTLDRADDDTPDLPEITD